MRIAAVHAGGGIPWATSKCKTAVSFSSPSAGRTTPQLLFVVPAGTYFSTRIPTLCLSAPGAQNSRSWDGNQIGSHLTDSPVLFRTWPSRPSAGRASHSTQSAILIGIYLAVARSGVRNARRPECRVMRASVARHASGPSSPRTLRFSVERRRRFAHAHPRMLQTSRNRGRSDGSGRQQPWCMVIYVRY